MKIAILADPLDNQSAGVHTYTKQLIRALINFDEENEYILIREKKDPTLPLEQITVPNIRLPIGFASLRLFFIIPFLVKRLKVDAVFEPAHFGPFNLPKRIKRITMIHDMTPLMFPQYHRFQSQLLQRIFLKRILGKADLILSNSENTSKDIARIFPKTKSRIQTILLGRDEDFKPLETKEFLEKTDIKHRYFLFTGTIEPRKNLPVLLKAFCQFREKEEEKVLLVITGQIGWRTESFFEILDNHPFKSDIILTGFVAKKSLMELYSHAIALVYPSLYEGFGLPVIEALSCGTRVICSNTSSLPEVGGNSARYFDPEKPEDLLVHLNEVWREHMNPEKRISLIMQSEKFSWESYVREFVEALKKM